MLPNSSWLELRDLKPLPKEEIDAFVAKDSKPKSGALKRAYQTAQNPEEWEAGHAERMAKRAAGEDQEPPKKKQRKNAGDSSKAKKAPASSSKKVSFMLIIQINALLTPGVQDSTDSKAKSGKKDDKKKPSSAAESQCICTWISDEVSLTWMHRRGRKALQSLAQQAAACFPEWSPA